MNFQSNKINKLNINEALKLLKNQYVLVSYKDNQRYVFLIQENKVLIKTGNFSLVSSINDFVDNFKNFNFGLIENQGEEINLEKDLDYYKNIQKRQWFS